MFNLEKFISHNVIKRNESLFQKDVDANGEKLKQAISNKRMLVIGGAGSIGSAFIKECLLFKPKSLVVVDINENGLTELTRDLRNTSGLTIPDDYAFYPISYASDVFRKMYQNRGGFDIVANFSAHKHVRSEKDIYSIEAMLKNNLLDARNLLDFLVKLPPRIFFCVSTDKAANPVNIMGASKRVMEDMIFSYSNYFSIKTARFANVAFSNGSLPAGFLNRLDKLQPISAPSDVKRYFVSPKESGQICMLACMLGENCEIYFPKLKAEEMLTFSNIASALLTEKGYSVDYCDSDTEALRKSERLKLGSMDYPVHYSSSDTTGEKQYEEFYTSDEIADMSHFSALGVIKNITIPSEQKIDLLFSKLHAVLKKQCYDKAEIIEVFKWYLPNFAHEEKNKSLDGKM